MTVCFYPVKTFGVILFIQNWHIYTLFLELNGDATQSLKDEKDVDDDDDTHFKPDDILIQLGGCGIFQMLMAIIIQTMKLVVCWVTGGNSFFAFVPRWRCLEYDLPIANESLIFQYSDVVNSTGGVVNINESIVLKPEEYWNQQCKIGEASCIRFEYEEGMHTLVPEVSIEIFDKLLYTSCRPLGVLVTRFIASL